jgi:hypothetical protein
VLAGSEGNDSNDHYARLSARRTMSRMAFWSDAKREGQALTKRARAGSDVAGASNAPITLDSTLHESEIRLFSEDFAVGSTPTAATCVRR